MSFYLLSMSLNVKLSLMKKSFLIITFLFLSAATISFADQTQQVITLKDGSQIKGELSKIDNGVYTIKTPMIGDVHVAASDVISITNGSASAALPPAGSFNGGMDQEMMTSMSSPQSMAIIQQMVQDPEILKALSDPALVQAVVSHNYQAAQNNPKIQELMSNPKIQALLQQVAAQQQQKNTSSQ